MKKIILLVILFLGFSNVSGMEPIQRAKIKSQLQFLEQCKDLFIKILSNNYFNYTFFGRLLNKAQTEFKSLNNIKDAQKFESQLTILINYAKEVELAILKYVFLHDHLQLQLQAGFIVFYNARNILFSHIENKYIIILYKTASFIDCKFCNQRFNNQDISEALFRVFPSCKVPTLREKFFTNQNKFFAYNFIVQPNICEPLFIHDYLCLTNKLFDNNPELFSRKKFELIANLNHAIQLPEKMKQRKSEIINFFRDKILEYKPITDAEIKQNKFELFGEKNAQTGNWLLYYLKLAKLNYDKNEPIRDPNNLDKKDVYASGPLSYTKNDEQVIIRVTIHDGFPCFYIQSEKTLPSDINLSIVATDFINLILKQQEVEELLGDHKHELKQWGDWYYREFEQPSV